MDKIVGAIQGLSNSDPELKQLKTLLMKEENVILKSFNVLDDVLGVLDPVAHSLGYAYVLAAKTMAPKLDGSRFFGQAAKFLISCSGPQIRLAPGKTAQICKKFAQISIENGLALRAVKPLRSALQKLRMSSDSVTPAHADFVQVCLVAKCYGAAVPILEDEIFEVNPEVSAITPKDLLLYYYYGGMIYTGLKDFKKALAFFKTGISIPAMVLSQIMVESYKKFLLLSLLVHGRLIPIPKYASGVIQRHSKTSFPHYQELATAYSTNSTDDVHKIAQQHFEAFTKDKNFGLVKQCIQSLYRRNVQKLTQTYLTLSLQDIATSVKLKSAQEAEEMIVRMVDKGEIFATINQKDGMVSFHEDSEQYDTTSMLNFLDQQVQGSIDLAKKVRAADESISCSPAYLQKTSMHERGRGGWGEFEEFIEGAEKGAVMGGPVNMSMGGPGKMS